jgi:hypothetical protein
MNQDQKTAIRILEHLNSEYPPTGITLDQMALAREALGHLKGFYSYILRLRHVAGMNLRKIASTTRLAQFTVSHSYQLALEEYVRQLVFDGVIERCSAPTGNPRRSHAGSKKNIPASFACSMCKAQVTIPDVIGETFLCCGCGAMFRTGLDSRGVVMVEILNVQSRAVEREEPWTLAGCYELLGMSSDMPFPAARKAYLDKIQQYHPDKVHHLGPELRALAESMSKRINHAWELIAASY